MQHLNVPKAQPLLRELQWVFNPLNLLERCVQRYGDTFQLFENKGSSVVFFSHPQAIKEIFSADPDIFDTGRSNRLLQPVFGDYSLLLLDGVPHQRQRRLLMPPFHGNRMQLYAQLIRNIIEEVISQWEIGKSIPIRLSMQEISLRIILQTVFGLEEGQHFERLKRLLVQSLDAISSPITSSLLFFPSLRHDWGTWSPWGQFLHLKEQIDQLLYQEIRQRRQEMDSSRPDILTLLLLARDEDDRPMTDIELRDELITLLFAGHETTASALVWAMYWIHYLPEVRNQLLNELSTIDSKSDPTAIAQLPYLNAVCQETLRLSPIFLTAQDRILKAPLKVMDYQFEPGAVLVPCIYLTHLREDIYSSPRQFRPDRFLKQKFSPYEYLPFGGGSRGCIGVAYANFQIKVFLGTILSQLEMSLVNQRPIKPVRRGATMAPPTDLLMVVNGSTNLSKKQSKHASSDLAIHG
jgi:cytochrome P450